MSGELPGVPLSMGDEPPVPGEGTGHNGLGGKLADRLDDGDTSNDTLVEWAPPGRRLCPVLKLELADHRIVAEAEGTNQSPGTTSFRRAFQE